MSTKSLVKSVSFLLVLSGAALSLPAQAKDGWEHGLTFDGQPRTYLLYRPGSAKPKTPAPLVIVLHGGFGSAKQAQKTYGWNKLADKQGFIVVYPDGIGRSWNAGGDCCGPARRDGADDVGFLTKIIETVSRSEAVDPQRIYMAGLSNGAAMAYRYACEGAVPLAAIGSVAGTLAMPCEKPKPTSVMAIHGLADRHVPFNGGKGTKGVTAISWLSVEQTLDAFRRADRCPAPPVVQDGLPLRAETSACPQGRDVALIAIEGAGHQWPGSATSQSFFRRLLRLDPPSDAMDATMALGAFFERHRAD